MLRQPDARASKVLENRILTHGDGPQKRHIGDSAFLQHILSAANRSLTEIALPDGMEYRAGDYLAVYVHTGLKVEHC